MGIITSWLDNDLYNFHQGSFFHDRHHGAVGTYVYKCRDSGVDLSMLKDRLESELDNLCRLRMGCDEADQLRMVSLCSDAYVHAITSRPVLERQDVVLRMGTGGLELRYSGPLYKRILVETPLLATISQLYFEATMTEGELKAAHRAGASWIREQANYLLACAPDGFRFTEGGTRRRFSKAHQEEVLLTLKEKCPQYLAATSNVLLGLKHGIKVVGTMAHQLQMYYQTIVPLEDSITHSLLDWDSYYKGALGTALTDTLGDRKWDYDFRRLLMLSYHTERHDSECPYAWGEKRLRALEREGVDTEGRSLLFSDSLDLDKAMALWRTFVDRIGVGIMIGTHLVNTIPMPRHKPLSQVIKLQWAAASPDQELRPVVKLGNGTGKGQCECPSLSEHARWVASSCPVVDTAAQPEGCPA